LELSAYSRPRPPGNLANLDRTTPLVRALGAFFALVGLLGLGHAVVVSVRRRRRDLATLRALGFVRGQVRSVVRWEAVTIGAVGAVLGIPLGLVAGRAAFHLMVDDLGLLDDAANPWIVVVLGVPAVALAALLLAWWPARHAARAAVATSLRTE
jgi:ABC-type antimicrobial peptide transport system permease subunit